MIHNGHFRNRSTDRTPRSRLGRITATFTLEDYELARYYREAEGLDYNDAAWKVYRLNREFSMCGWRASRLEMEGNPESVNEAAKLREFFGEPKTCPDGLVDGDCTCTPRDDMPCSYCREKARKRYASEPEDTALPYTNEDWINNFMSKVNPPLAEMSRK
jgi:hypothetical protein